MAKTLLKEVVNKLFRLLIAGKEKKILLIISIFLALFLVFKGGLVTSWGPSSNYENVSVRSTVNVTNSYPEILNITCNNDTAITLTAGSTYRVDCVVEIRDYNGWNDINYMNGTFYFHTNESSSPDNNNSHYTNASCINTSDDGVYLANWTCSFDVWYHAVNGTWEANATVNDSYGANDNAYGDASVSALLALNITNPIDFGDLAVTETSPSSVEANVTNFGNVPINVSVYGFGGEDPVLGDNLAMICDQRNLSLHNERYSLNSGAAYGAMTRLTNAAVTVPGLKVEKQTVSGTFVVNSTYWMIHINVSDNPFGICNGTVVFAAESP